MSTDPAARGSALRLVSELVGRGLAFVAALAIARGLGPASFGAFAVLWGVAWVVAEGADLGLAGTASRALTDRSWRLRDLVRAKLALSAGVLGLAAATALASGGSGPLRALALLVVAVVAVSWVEAIGIALRCARRPAAEVAVLIAARTGSLVAVGAAASMDAALEGYALATAVAPLPALLAAAAMVARAYREDPAPARSAAALCREALPVGLATALSLIAFRIELWLLLPLRGPAAAGLFGGALRAFDGLKLIPAALTQGALPYLVMESGVDTGRARPGTLRTIVLLGVPAAVSLFALAPQLVGLLLGEAFADAALPTRLLALAIVPAFVNAFVLQDLLAADRAREMPVLMALRLCISLVLGLLVIPAAGAPGAALTCAVAETLVLSRGLRLMRGTGLVPPLLAALREAARGALPLVGLLLLWPGPLGLALGLAAYAVGVARWRS